MTARSTQWNRQQTDRTMSSIGEKQGQSGSYTGVKDLIKIQEPMNPELHPHGHGGGLLIFIHRSITFSKQPSSPEALSDPHLEELTIKADLGNTKFIISNIYMPVLFNISLSLSHNLSDSGEMEVFIDHPNTETWQGHLHRNFISAYLASLPSRESSGVSDSFHYQQISTPCSRPTRF